MREFAIAGVILLLILASSGVGQLLQPVMREHHRSRETVDAVRLVISILVTFTALVLGLVTNSVKSSYDLFDARLRGFAGDIIELDQRLREYGADTDPLRAALRTYVAAAIADTWRDEPRPTGDYPTFAPTPGYERQDLGNLLFDLDGAIRRLEPTDEFHRKLADSITVRMTDTLQQRWRIVITPNDTLSMPFIALMAGWLVIIFCVFGLCSPRNLVVSATILMCALSISSAVYLILDLDGPLTGPIRVSSEPLRNALSHIDRPR